ncbi:hypothetical protein ACQRIU_004369 [Beauveria bassiana]
MTYPSGFSMPGAFHNDVGATTASPPLIFRPPVSSPSPSASAFLERRRRKRGRPGTAATADDDAPAVVSLFGTAAVPQHTPVKAYALAGTLDTPDHAEADVLGESMYSDSNYRTALGSKRSRHDNDDDDASSGGAPTSLFRHEPPASVPQGWGSVAISAVGGVVGRVWEFCKAGAFKGFYAGGGRGFAMTLTGATVERPDDDAPLPPADDYSCNYHFHHYDDYEHRVPGHFPASQTDDASYHFRAVVDDTAPPTPANNEQHHRYPCQPASPSPSIPAAKRRQTTHADDLGRNWVFVNDGAHNNSRSSSGHRSSPRNRNYTPSVTTGRRISATPNSSRASMPSAPRFSYRPETPSEQQQRRPPSSASYASPRSASPTKPTSTPYTHHLPYTTASTASIASPSQTHSYSGSQSRGSVGGAGHRRRRSGTVASTSAHRRANSAASAASSRGDSGESHSPRKIDSPRLDAEAKQLAARRKMEERDADVRISAFNKRLQDMIRQGKEALGTTIEIDDAAGDDWVDEE